MHLLRLSHEIERERLHVSALHENSAVIAQWAHAQLIDDLPLAHAVFEAEALRWPLITTASGPLKKYRQLGVVTETLPDL